MAPRAVRKNAGKPMQDVHFRTLEEMFEYIPTDERALVEVLHVLVLRTIPDVEERLSYNVPFSKEERMFAFCGRPRSFGVSGKPMTVSVSHSVRGLV